MSFSEKLQRLRKNKNISQEELAEIMNVSRQAVSKWESGQSIPDIDKLVEISNYFNVSVDNLLKDEKEIIQKDLLETKEVKTSNNLFNSKAKRMILGALAGACICICFNQLLVVGQIGNKYQAIMTFIYCSAGIAISLFGLLKIKKYKQKDG